MTATDDAVLYGYFRSTATYRVRKCSNNKGQRSAGGMFLMRAECAAMSSRL